jgi:imidazolonepropionase-like amidohydrolase
VERIRAWRPGPRRLAGTKVNSLVSVASAALMLAGLAVFIMPRTVRSDGPRVYAIRDAQIVTGTGKTIQKCTIVFRDGLIVDVGESAHIPADARVIDGSGLTVYPGLIDGYTNLGMTPPPAATPAPAAPGQGRQAARPVQTAPVAQQEEQAHGDPSLQAADEVKPGGTAIEAERSTGVTAALASPNQGIFAGQSALVNLAGDEAARMVVRAPVALTVQFRTSAGFFGIYPNSLMGTVAFIRQTFYDAVHYRDEQSRYDRVKRGVARPEHDKRLAALLPALKGELPVLFVANSDLDIRRALMIADEFHLKPIIQGALTGYRVADLLASSKVPVILSVNYPKRSADLPQDVEEPLRVLRERAEAPAGPSKLAAAGIKFAFSSAGLGPADFMINIRKAIESGLSKDAALKALTLSAAEILGASDQLGTLETGKIANLVVTSGDLFDRAPKLRYVFIDGNEIELKKPEPPARGGGPGAPGTGRGAAADPSGTWRISVHTPQGDHDVNLTVSRQGNAITGTLQGPEGPSQIRNATLEGNRLRFEVTINVGGDSLECVFSGMIEGDSIAGAITAGSMGSFDFSGARPHSEETTI